MSSLPPQPFQPMGAQPAVPYASAYVPPPTGRPPSVTALGIIGIVISALILLCTPFSLAFMFVDLGMKNPVLDAMRNDPMMRAYSIVSASFSLLIMIGLLFSSIASLSLKPWARSTMVILAAISMAHVVVGQIVNAAWYQPKLLAAMQSSGMPTTGMVGGTVGAVLGLLISLPYPICVLYFFTRPKVKSAFATAEANAV